MPLLIPPTITLAFDPDTITDEEMCEVITDDLAWAIWLLWRPCHITSQYFNRTCIANANRIRERNPQGMNEWRDCIRGIDFPHEDVDEWISQAYPFLIGIEPIRIEVKPRPLG